MESRERTRLLARRCLIGIPTRRNGREFDSGDADREIGSDSLRVYSSGGGNVLNAALVSPSADYCGQRDNEIDKPDGWRSNQIPLRNMFMRSS